jgi:hypothetical protein
VKYGGGFPDRRENKWGLGSLEGGGTMLLTLKWLVENPEAVV